MWLRDTCFVHKLPKLWKVIIGDVIPDLIFFFMLTSIACVMCTCVCMRERGFSFDSFFNLKYLAVLVFSLKRIFAILNYSSLN